MGSDYVIGDLIYYNEKIEAVAREKGLDFYPQEFELCSYEDMIGYEAYSGMPSRYPHWSFGKSYERKKTFYRYNLTGLPYEMVINSNPCLAYLMKDNTLLLQILTMAHVYGHNDFFKNNRFFKIGTRAENTLEMFKTHADKIRGYITDPSIGYARVERILDAAHAIRFQTTRIIGEKRLSHEEIKERLLSQFMPKPADHPLLDDTHKTKLPDLDKIPLMPEEDLLLFLYEYASLKDWEKDILLMLREESLYFLPQIETKIMNEGWASYWHYQILKGLNLPSDLYLEFLKRHNQVIAAIEGGINPYHLGFKIFEKLAAKYDNPDFIFEVRKQERDVSFLRRYLDEQLCRELNLFQFKKSGRDYVISEIADEEGFEKIKDTLIANAGINSIPNIRVMEIGKNNTLMLEHEWDGRELNLEYAHNTVKHIAGLWGGRVRLKTRVRNTIQIIESE